MRLSLFQIIMLCLLAQKPLRDGFTWFSRCLFYGSHRVGALPAEAKRDFFSFYIGMKSSLKPVVKSRSKVKVGELHKICEHDGKSILSEGVPVVLGISAADK